MVVKCSLCERTEEPYKDKGLTDVNNLPAHWAQVSITFQGGQGGKQRILCDQCTRILGVLL